ncbi:sugar phosphate isomerase/epimerase family protein [Desulfopila aestuarii]|uniref:Sugar phosphate isomerase/epimerase n=1 Tax=Desulfopila aestuarii DSM 18488 TaxID=1121416 RepID=A0A1M7XXK9_9BACT|nr:sugar phosphate isomerase/epimerase [Desulfopila aestuarii]SHO43694.1 Sugar phosphate isomerase/epimerase [Desulfopila aestuarii DSM 18488]
MKIGVMNNPSKSVYDEATFCGNNGFDFLDLTIEGPEAASIDVEKLRPILDSYGLTITGHTDPCLPYAYPIQGLRDACLKELERCAGIFAALGARVMNIHPCYFCPPAMRKDLVSFHIEALRPIVEMAASYGLTMVFENFKAPFDRVSTFKILLKEVDGLQLHLDFGHSNLGVDNHEVFCRELGEHIQHVHFSDNRSRSDDHMPLGVGSVNWQNAVKVLKATGYNSTITLEVFCNDPNMQDKYLDMSRKMIQDLWG